MPMIESYAVDPTSDAALRDAVASSEGVTRCAQ